MKDMHIAFSPPDITEAEIEEVVDTLRSGWITTGPKTKEFERQIARLCHTSRAACLNSATACAEMALRAPNSENRREKYAPTSFKRVMRKMTHVCGMTKRR